MKVINYIGLRETAVIMYISDRKDKDYFVRFTIKELLELIDYRFALTLDQSIVSWRGGIDFDDNFQLWR